MINLTECITSVKAIESCPDLQQWWQQAIALPALQVQVRRRGNNLYILCESSQPPAQGHIRSRVIRALLKTDIAGLLPAGAPPIYQVNLYGKAIGQTQPDWIRIIYLDQLQAYARKVEAVRQVARQGKDMPLDDGPPSTVLAQSNLQLAQQGNPEAIARHLSQFLSQQGIAVRAMVKALFNQGQERPLRRLVIYCEAAYSPDPNSLIEPIAERLRNLALTTFRDAVVYAQVQGEAAPEWKLRIDLTPPTQILRMWSRWGDLEAMLRLANQALAPQQIQVSGIVLDMILHLTCWRSPSMAHRRIDVPLSQLVLKPLRELFDQIAPQGIHTLAIYASETVFAQPTPQCVAPEPPVWCERFDLPAASQPHLAITTAMAARRGDLGAIGFLLTRVLNADLDRKLATGGLQSQARYRDDLLHVMVDGTVLPPEKPTATAVIDCVRSLKISGVNGVRIYGRRAGEKRPCWKQGYDLTSRARLVPEAAPEFAASEAYVGDLITQQPGALLVRPDLNSTAFHQLWSRLGNRLREALLATQIFSPLVTARSLRPVLARDQVDAAWLKDLKLAAVWSTLGILMTVCTDQGLVRIMPSSQPAPAQLHPPAPPELSLAGLTLTKSANASDIFNRSGFTAAGGRSVLANRPELKLSHPSAVAINQNGKPLISSPDQPHLSVPSEQFTWNVPQLNQKLVLYEQFVAQSGVPDILIMGSSRALRGVDPVALQDGLSAQGYAGRKVFNFGVNGATAQMVDFLVRRLIPAEKLPKLILWADGARAFNSARVDVTYNAMTSSPSYAKQALTVAVEPEAAAITQLSLASFSSTSTVLSARYDAWNQQINQMLAQRSATYDQRSTLIGWMRDVILTKAVPPIVPEPSESVVAGADGEDLAAIDVNGFLPLAARFNPTTYYQKFARVSGAHDADYTTFRTQGQQTASLKRMVDYVKQQGSSLVFVNLPLSSDYLDADRRQHEATFQQFMIQSAASLEFTYRNLVENWPSAPDYFSDPSHLNRYGAYAVSQQLARDPMIPWGVQ